MDVGGFGEFVSFGEIGPGTLFLDRAPSAVDDTAILLKVCDEDGRSLAVRIFDRAAIDRGVAMPHLTSAPAPARRVVALSGYGIEIENSVDNVAWDSASDFVRAVIFACSDGTLCLKAYKGRQGDDFDCQLFNLATGAVVDRGHEVVGFRRWSIVGRNAKGEGIDLYCFEP